MSDYKATGNNGAPARGKLDQHQTALRDVEAELNKYINAGRELNDRVPTRSTAEIAQWFLNAVFNPIDKLTEEVNRWQSESGARVSTPYADRVRYLIKKFLHLPADDHGYVLAAAQDGIHWRGDDMDLFHRIVDETLHYLTLNPTEKGRYKRASDMRRRAFVSRAVIAE